MHLPALGHATRHMRLHRLGRIGGHLGRQRADLLGLGHSAAVWGLEAAFIRVPLGVTSRAMASQAGSPPNHAPLKRALGVLIFRERDVHEVGTKVSTVSA